MEEILPEGLVQERRDRIRVLAEEARAEAQKLGRQSDLTEGELQAKVEHESEAAAYEDAYQIMGVGMAQPSQFYPVWLNHEQAMYLIDWLKAWNEPPLSAEPELETINRAHLKAIVTKIRGAAGSKGQSDSIYAASHEAVGRA